MGNSKKFLGGLAIAETVKELYGAGQTDYSLDPIVLVDASGNPIGRIGDHDGVIFCCRRGEREIQLTEAFVEPQTGGFARKNIRDLTFVILTLYHEKFKDLPVAFAPSKVKDTLGDLVSRAGLRQLRVSESEKFAHVTFFFNGGNNQPYPGEEDIRVPSPKGVAFDTVPELSLPAVVDKVNAGIDAGYDFIVTNFANGDVIGHTQNWEAKIRCAEFVDLALGKVVDRAKAAGYLIMVTADHGNLEEAKTEDGSPHVSHTANPVPFILINGSGAQNPNVVSGKLSDIAPTILQALGISPSPLMEGSSLITQASWTGRQKVLLIILDGWGIGKKDENNPIHMEKTPTWDSLLEKYPFSQLEAAGEGVGLKQGKAGNSEAGHINLGAGRVVLQDDVRLDQAMQDGSFFTNEIFLQTLEKIRQNHSALHLLALLTEKSSHGSIDYPLALLKLAKQQGLDKAYVHVIFDGRSTEPGSAPALLGLLESKMDEVGIGQIVSGIGRGIALDRDGNYAKTKKAYDLLVSGVGKKASQPEGQG